MPIKPPLASHSWYGPRVKREAKDKVVAVLADNLGKIMSARKYTQTDLQGVTRVPQRTISRVLRKDNAARIDSIEAIAHGCDLEPWQLLVPKMDPKRPPELCHPGHEHPPRWTEIILQIAELLEQHSEAAQRRVLDLLEEMTPKEPGPTNADAKERRSAAG